MEAGFDKYKTEVWGLRNEDSGLSDQTQKFKLQQNSKTQIVTKLKNANCDKTQKFKLWQNSKTQIVTKLKNFNCDKTQKTQIKTKL